MKNDAKYPTVSTEIAALPTTVPKPIEQFTEADIRYNLTMQLVALAVKEGWQSNFRICSDTARINQVGLEQHRRMKIQCFLKLLLTMKYRRSALRRR